MQGCFRKYPDVYGAEIDSDAEDDEDEIPAHGASANAVTDASRTGVQPPSGPLSSTSSAKTDSSLVPQEYRPSSETDRAKKATEQVQRDHKPTSEAEQLVPKAAHDASDANVEKK
jgi:intermembrane space import and assembly protein 40